MLSISAARRVSAGARATRGRGGGGRVAVGNGGVGVGGRGGSSSSISGSNTSLRRPLSSILSNRAGAPTLLLLRTHQPQQLLFPSSFYSTERILSLRAGNKNRKELLPKTLYAPERETENCGVGLVASLKSVASRKVVEDADEMLIRMSHRGGVGCCPASGDGAGELIVFHTTLISSSLPLRFLMKRS